MSKPSRRMQLVELLRSDRPLTHRDCHLIANAAGRKAPIPATEDAWIAGHSVDADFMNAVHEAANGRLVVPTIEPGKRENGEHQERLTKLIVPTMDGGEREALARLLAGGMSQRKGNRAQINAADRALRRWTLQRLRLLTFWWKRRKRPPSYGSTLHKDAVLHISRTLKMGHNGPKQLESWYQYPSRYGADIPSGYWCDRKGTIRPLKNPI
jgi:hypothetical protein